MKILIMLVAVIVVIVIVGLLALRYLRADDADPFDEVPDEPRRPGRAPSAEPEPPPVRQREHALAAAGRRPSNRPAPVDDQQQWSAGRAPRGREASHPGFRERDSQGRDSMDRPASPDRRANQGRPSQAQATQNGGPGRPVPAGPRPAKPARSAEAAAQPTNWDSMSDVDYWTELAADKPLSDTSPGRTAGPAAAPAGRRNLEPITDARPAGRGEPAHLPVRQRSARTAGGRAADFGRPQPAGPRPAHAPGRYADGSSEPATQSIAALARLGSQSPAPPAAAAPQPSSQSRPRLRPVPPPPLDDDPLTSPSFPAINDSDSRSYRASRPQTQPGSSRPAAAYGEATQQFGSYPAGTSRPHSQPNGYPVQPAAPAGNPYGSFVSQPAASYQQPPAASQQGSSYPGYPDTSQPGAVGNGWYGAPGQAAPTPAAPTLSPVPDSYLSGGQFGPGHEQPGYHHGYQNGQPEAAGYAQPTYQGPQYDQRGYGGQEPGYGHDGYQAYPGYGTGGY